MGSGVHALYKRSICECVVTVVFVVFSEWWILIVTFYGENFINIKLCPWLIDYRSFKSYHHQYMPMGISFV